MGYTTEFQGRFDCWRAEGPTMAEMLKAARAGDAVARRAVADWLAEQGDPRAAKAAGAAPGGGEKFWKLFGLKPEHAAYMRQFAGTRRMKRAKAAAAARPDPLREAVGLEAGREGGWFVGGSGFMGQDEDDSVLDYNKPPAGQPGLWCQWVPNKAGTAIEWNGGEKFYCYVEWLEYLLKHFLTPWGYTVEGDVEWQGEDEEDRGKIHVRANKVSVEEG